MNLYIPVHQAFHFLHKMFNAFSLKGISKIELTILLKKRKGCDLIMLTNKELNTLKNALLEMKDQASRREKETYPKESMQDTSGELSMYDNHPADMGTALFEREKDLALHEHAESELGKVEHALKAIEEGSYGVCEVCRKPIAFERLETVPYTTFCVEHAELVEQSVEEDVALNSIENPFESTQDGRARDYENSFDEVAEFGTSDSPSDFTDNARPAHSPNYSDSEEEEESQIDQIVADSLTDDT